MSEVVSAYSDTGAVFFGSASSRAFFSPSGRAPNWLIKSLIFWSSASAFAWDRRREDFVYQRDLFFGRGYGPCLDVISPLLQKL
jgi:hypothetical protein